MMEVALVFDKAGKTIHWHLPPGRRGDALPDSRDLWLVLWENRHNLGGVAHTHPWDGPAWFSHEDVTTFSATDKALGQKLLWPVVTFTEAVHYQWAGPGPYDYNAVGFEGHKGDPAKWPLPPIQLEDLEELRARSR